MKNNKVVANRPIGFAETNDSNNVTKIIEFNVSNDYIISLDTKTKKGNTWKIIKNEKFIIDKSGKIVEKK